MIVLKFYLENNNFIGAYYIASVVPGTTEGSESKRVILKEDFVILLARKYLRTKSDLSLHEACLDGGRTYLPKRSLRVEGAAGPPAWLLPCCCYAEFLMIFEQRAPHFCFVVGPTNNVVGPGRRDVGGMAFPNTSKWSLVEEQRLDWLG